MLKIERISLRAGLLLVALAEPASAEVKGYDDNLSDSTPAVLIDVDRTTGNGSLPPELAACPSVPPNTVFSVGFTTGYAFIGDTLYGLEVDPTPGSNDVYLYSMAADFCATGTRVGTTPAGFESLESLAYCPADGFLYSVDFDFAAHQGQLIRIDPASGIGTAVGNPMARDVWIVGLACDSASAQLFAVTAGFADRNIPELYAIDRNTGAETLVGATGTNPGDLQSLTCDNSSVPPRLLAAGMKLYEIDRSTGEASLIGGTYTGTVWALANRPALAPPTTTPTSDTTTPTPTATASRTATATATVTQTTTPTSALPTTTPTSRPTPAGAADANCDGLINDAEPGGITRAIFDPRFFEACMNADTNRNGRPDAADYPALMKLLAG